MMQFLKKMILFGDAKLRFRRDRISQDLSNVYDDIETLERQNETLVCDGKRVRPENILGKRKIAQKILRVREEIRRQHVLSKVFNTQINILDTQLHNRLIAKKSKIVKLPNIDQLTETVVAADEAVLTLSELHDAATNSHISVEIVNTSEEEIMRELGAIMPEIPTKQESNLRQEPNVEKVELPIESKSRNILETA